jgi:hypothetical protein
MWGIGASGSTGSVTTQRFRMATNQAPGTTFVWEKLGVAVGTESDGFYFGEDGPVCLVESRNQIWRGGNDTTQDRSAVNLYRIDTNTGSVIDRFTRGGAIAVSGSKGTLPLGSARFNMYGLACEIHPQGDRPAMVLAYLNADSRPMGWYLFDVDSAYPTGSPSVYYGPLRVLNSTGVNIVTKHMPYSCMRHLHGTQKIYLSYGDWKGSEGAYVTRQFMRLTIPAGTTAAAVASGTWTIDEVSPAGTLQPPTSYVPQIAGKFNLVQDMGDGRPAIVNLVLQGKSSGLRPHVWFLKMPTAGL